MDDCEEMLPNKKHQTMTLKQQSMTLKQQSMTLGGRFAGGEPSSSVAQKLLLIDNTSAPSNGCSVMKRPLLLDSGEDYPLLNNCDVMDANGDSSSYDSFPSGDVMQVIAAIRS